MDLREQRAIIIAAMCRIDKTNGAWQVPSQTSPNKTYAVRLEGKGVCSCPDCAENGFVCKHIRAVRMTLKRELGMDGITETRTIAFEEKKTYQQNWPAYDRAQAVEKEQFQELLFDLLKNLEEPERKKCGRKPHSHKDSIFSMCLKTYTLFSSRRASTDLREAHKKGFLSCEIPGTKVCKFFETAEFTPILKRLIAKSALPLRAVESQFAIDSSGFASSKFERWYDEKWGKVKRQCKWVKTHIACGTFTNVVTAVRILDQNAADSPQFAPLVRETSRGFQISEMSADKAYSSLENFETVADCGGTAFIAFKANATGMIGGLFEKMLGWFQYRQEDYLRRYHRRSNVESTFSMIKRKFGDAVMSRNETAMVNEVLCKILAHNICCLIQEQHGLGIDPTFWDEEKESKILEMPVIA